MSQVRLVDKTMKKRNIPSQNKGDRVKRQRDPIPWRYCFLTLVCGLLLVAGFFFAARQHFSVMDFAIKNAKLRREKESLESEQRRLYLTREISLSPSEIKKIAKKIGLQDLTAQSIEIMMPKKNTEKKQADKNPDNTPTQAFLSRSQNEKSDKSDKSSEKKTVEKKEVKETKSKPSSTTALNARPQIAKK